MCNTSQDINNHVKELLGLPPTHIYLPKKFLGLARASARGYLNHICSTTDQQKMPFSGKRTKKYTSDSCLKLRTVSRKFLTISVKMQCFESLIKGYSGHN